MVRYALTVAILLLLFGFVSSQAGPTILRVPSPYIATFAAKGRQECFHVSLEAQPTDVRVGSEARVDLHAVANVPDGTKVTYKWKTSRGKLRGSGHTDSVILDTAGLKVGAVNVTVTVSNGLCTATDSATITMHPASYGFDAGLPPVVVCTATPQTVFKNNGDQVVTVEALSRVPDNNPLTYTWTGGQNVKIKGNGPKVTVDTTNLAPGSYEVSVTVKGPPLGEVVCTVPVTVNEAPSTVAVPSASVAPYVMCVAAPSGVFKNYGDPVVTIEAFYAKDPDNKPLTYSWSADPNVNIKGNGSKVTVDTTDLALGTYPVKVTVSGFSDHSFVTCTSTFSVVEKLTGGDCPTVALGADPTEVGIGSKVTLHVSGPDSDDKSATYKWTADRGKLIGSGDVVTLDTTGLDVGPVKVTVTVTLGDGRCVGTDEAKILIVWPEIRDIAPVATCAGYHALNFIRLDDYCKAVLDDAASRLRLNPKAVLVLEGFSEKKEKRGVGHWRAEFVKDYLVNMGTDASRVVIKPAGTLTSPMPANGKRAVVIWLAADRSYVP